MKKSVTVTAPKPEPLNAVEICRSPEGGYTIRSTWDDHRMMRAPTAAFSTLAEALAFVRKRMA